MNATELATALARHPELKNVLWDEAIVDFIIEDARRRFSTRDVTPEQFVKTTAQLFAEGMFENDERES